MFGPQLHGPPQGVAEGLYRQLLFGMKVPVQAPFFEACRFHHILHRAAGEPTLVEDRCGLGDNPLTGYFSFVHCVLFSHLAVKIIQQ